MGGWFKSEEIKEKYYANKLYPKNGLISSDIYPGDEKRIERWLKSKDSCFGFYRVVEYLGRREDMPWPSFQSRKNSGGGITWKIQCNCGYERLIGHRQLISFRNHIIKRKSLPHCQNPAHDERYKTNTKFGLLTIVGYRLGLKHQTNVDLRNVQRIKKDKKRYLWLTAFKCDCGKYTKKNPFVTDQTSIYNLAKRGITQIGCGCLAAKHGGKSKTPEHTRWEAAKARAKKKNLPFNIEVEDCIAPENCPVLGIPLSVGDKTHRNSPTLDRIIPEKGYIKGNVIVISHKANSIKNNANYDEIRVVADWYESELRKRGLTE